eukprot:Rhum_TRINITY_DN19496_c0_g1::Rhum_TRINITY_DN19496_c0_g1_i1::g.170134::m.170134
MTANGSTIAERSEAENLRRKNLLAHLKPEFAKLEAAQQKVDRELEVELFKRVEIEGRERRKATVDERNAVLSAMTDQTAWGAAILTHPLLANQCTEEDVEVVRCIQKIHTTASLTDDDMVLRATVELRACPLVVGTTLWIEKRASRTTDETKIVTSGVTHSAEHINAMKEGGSKKRRARSVFGLLNLFKASHDEQASGMLLTILEEVENTVGTNPYADDMASISDTNDDDDDDDAAH